jgi:hypothetical protein
LVASGRLEDNVIAVLTRLDNERDALAEREIEQMPILDDSVDHEALGRERERGIAPGRTEGEQPVVLRRIEQVELRLLNAFRQVGHRGRWT